MNIQKEREAFETEMKSKCIFDLDYVQYHDVSNKYVIQNDLTGDEFHTALGASQVVNSAWLMWQAAKLEVGSELQSYIAVQSFSATNDGEDYIVVDANILAKKIEELTGANS